MTSAVKSRPAILASFALFGCLGVVYASFGALLPTFRDQYTLDHTALSLLISAFFTGSLLGTVAAGALNTERTARPAIILLLGLVATGAVGLALMSAWPLKVGSAAVAGLGFGGLILCVNTYFATLPGGTGLVLMNSLNGVFSIGAIAAPPLVGARLSPDFRLEYLVLAVAVLMCLPVTLLGQSQPDRAGSRLGALREAAPFAAALFFYAGLEIGLSTWATTHLLDLGYSNGMAAALTGLFWVGLAFGRLVIPLLVARRAPVMVVAGCLVGALLSLGLAALPATAPAGYLLAGMAAGPIFPTTLVCVSRASTDPRRANATAIAVAMLGAILLPAALGRLIDLSSPRIIPALIAVCVIASLACTLSSRVRNGRTAPAVAGGLLEGEPHPQSQGVGPRSGDDLKPDR